MPVTLPPEMLPREAGAEVHAGDVKLLEEWRLAQIAAFPIDGHDWCADLAVPYVKVGKHDLDTLIAMARMLIRPTETTQ